MCKGFLWELAGFLWWLLEDSWELQGDAVEAQRARIHAASFLEKTTKPSNSEVRRGAVCLFCTTSMV